MSLPEGLLGAVDVVGWTCPALLEEYGRPRSLHTPQEQLSEAQRNDLSNHSWVPMEHYFVDDSRRGQGTHYQYQKGQLASMVLRAGRALAQLAQRKAASAPGLLPDLQAPSSLTAHVRQQQKDMWFLDAAAQTIKPGARVLVFGSTEPWFEAVALALNASSVVTVEYNKLTYVHDRIQTFTPSEFHASAVSSTRFDVIISASSFDHDGLGRYGDPLDGQADLRAMRLCRCLLRGGGTLLLSIPIGPDVVVYNLHRRYGRRRLPHMLAGWTPIFVTGWDEARLDADNNFRQSFEPVWALRKTRLTKPSGQPSAKSNPRVEL
ncbi:uncharacterized protein MONBRDRAFT_8000 [Monosiga brevicollis MX1]|uniref:Uncharacterized protein n=1 Tax=Monosiga brevicollis TaxID=81824 RepID=A9UYR0_MONBE|nr:uncharacterized protein MONBRDRAFT_8000 [Monosiga brevicollis MX1]EDQ89505.1 predicted protein [Monosiga brevicollis MX1]|eukprot:XP_001745534.1 hypothetical protein [Monosiga brevicollis MX1]